MEKDVILQDLNELVSVITPAYNCEQFIRHTVECVAQQTIKVKEHIIIDDGSADNSLQLLNELKQRYPYLVVLSQINSGAGVARNLGISHATGKYIAFLDSDDSWAPTKLEQQIGFMENAHVLLSYGDYEEIDGLTEQLLHRYQLPDSLNYRQLLNGCPIGCLTVAYNQQALGKRYMPLVRRGQDWGLWLAITKQNVVARKYPGCLARYRMVKTSLSKNKWKKLLDVFDIYRKEQQLGIVPSCWHLIQHFRYVRRKRK